MNKIEHLEAVLRRLKSSRKISVDPIRSAEEIELIRDLLAGRPRDLLLFTLGINNGLRACDLLRLKVGQVRKMKPGDTIQIKESKTGKLNVLALNKKSHYALQQYINAIEPSDSDWLFPSQKGGHHIHTQRVRSLVKEWAREVHAKGENFGAHTLRKTFGYIQRVVYGVSFEVLCKRYNHSSPAVTMHYLGIEDREVNKILMNEI